MDFHSKSTRPDILIPVIGSMRDYGAPEVLGIWGVGVYIFMWLGSPGNYFREVGMSKLMVLGI